MARKKRAGKAERRSGSPAPPPETVVQDDAVEEEGTDTLLAEDEEDAVDLEGLQDTSGGGVQALWEAYAKAKTVHVRDLLIEHYIPLVRQLAERMATKMPPSVDVEDLKQAGMLGLIDAIDKFDHTRGIKFETYAAQRLRGAMVDDLRRYDWVPRLIRNKSHQLDRSRDELETRLKRVATDEELAAHLNITMEQYEKLRRDTNVKTMVSLDRKWDDGEDNEIGHLETLQDTRTRDPIDEMHRAEIKSLAIRGLSSKEKAVLVMYYYDNMSLKEIGAVLEISESRVCQIHQQTLDLLREKFVARDVTPF